MACSYELTKGVCNLFAQRKFFKSFLEKDTLGNRCDAKNRQQKDSDIKSKTDIKQHKELADISKRCTDPKSSFITQRLKSEVDFGFLE